MIVIVALIAVPAAGAALTALVPVRARLATTLATATATLLLAVLGARTVLREGATTFALNGTSLALVADGLGTGLALVTATVALLATLFAAAQRSSPAVHHAYWPLSLALLTGINGVVLAGDLLTAYLMLELVAVSGAVLVALGGGRARLAASVRYFYAEMAASITVLLGIALLWRATGAIALEGLGAALDTTEGRIGLAVVTAGLLLKMPLFPLHYWLPAAHSLASAAVSPWLSALVVKSAAVILLRVWAADPALLATATPQVLGALGAVAVLWGGIAALRQTELKRVVAYSTIAQIGLIMVALPLVAAGSADGWVGGTVQAITHALPKAALLMALAILAAAGGGSTVTALAGAAARRPVAVLAVGASAISIIGLPPSGGFVAKWYLLVGSLDTGQWWWAVTVVLGGLLTAAYLGRLVQACLGPPAAAPTPAPLPRVAGGRGSSVTARAAPLSMTALPAVTASPTVAGGVAEAVALTLALLGILIGLVPEVLVTLVGGAGSWLT
jgi:multicomponent Na+:H+ antiporter subunit D